MNNTNTIRKLTICIFEVTQKIQEKFPELYLLLSETPLFSSESKKPINVSDLGKYLNTLKKQLQMFEKERKGKMLK
jgi:hypothetical protein